MSEKTEGRKVISTFNFDEPEEAMPAAAPAATRGGTSYSSTDWFKAVTAAEYHAHHRAVAANAEKDKRDKEKQNALARSTAIKREEDQRDTRFMSINAGNPGGQKAPLRKQSELDEVLENVTLRMRTDRRMASRIHVNRQTSAYVLAPTALTTLEAAKLGDIISDWIPHYIFQQATLTGIGILSNHHDIDTVRRFVEPCPERALIEPYPIRTYQAMQFFEDSKAYSLELHQVITVEQFNMYSIQTADFLLAQAKVNAAQLGLEPFECWSQTAVSLITQAQANATELGFERHMAQIIAQVLVNTKYSKKLIDSDVSKVNKPTNYTIRSMRHCSKPEVARGNLGLRPPSRGCRSRNCAAAHSAQ